MDQSASTGCRHIGFDHIFVLWMQGEEGQDGRSSAAKKFPDRILYGGSMTRAEPRTR